ncbi:membrane-associated phospholipid phosphatase [Nocardiopsis arvandica]|uniref:Membrane-associated phospholipid phosphatase n=1 Tax=Nocardiopsis sinuspersici TaxID=501010 RepID=A0A7Z0BLL1_9ACTN|nr:phosphatase PAP2 family protein [Nocardiopsis sinuspersici]NYH54315.1 membrane-associated phospholipid phosphatase [Nocardiopsis sinuspersici]
MNDRTAEQGVADVLWEAEATPVLWLQGLGDWLAYPLGAVTHLGSHAVVIVGLTLVFWCLSPGLGVRLFVVVASSSVLNYLFKSVLYGARPSWFDARIKAHVSHGSFGVPSGHAQGAMVAWGYLGLRSGRRAVLWAAAAVIALVALSRVYLGAHFISDVLAGLLLGALVLWAALRWEERITAWWLGLSTARWVGCALALTLLPCVAATLWQLLVRDGWTAPVAWTGAIPTDPAGETLTGLYTASGTLLGGLCGFTLLAGRGWYSARGTLVSRAARFVLGISVIVLVQVVVDVLFGELSGPAASAVAFLAYAGIAFWASYLAPEMFVRSGLAERPGPPDPVGDSARGPVGDGDRATGDTPEDASADTSSDTSADPSDRGERG